MRRWQVTAGRPARLAIIAVCGTLGLLAAACSSTAPPAGGGARGHAGGPAAAPGAAQISITPGNGSRRVKPNHGVSVTVTSGKLTNVTLDVGHDPISGVMGKGDTSWHTRWALHPATRYTVTATALGANHKAVTATSSFRTLAPATTDTAMTILGNQTYGVGMPIVICLSSPVTKAHQAQVERAIQVRSSKPVTGAWIWATPQGTCSGSAQALIFRTREYWPQHTKVSFDAHLDGLEAAPGMYFTSNLKQSFEIGRSLIAVVDTASHHAKIYYKNKLYQKWPVSTGQAGSPETETANGAYLSIEKGNPVLMSGPGYKNVPVFFSVRFTWSGNYMHDAPWSVGSQGFANVSHGCVNLSPADSQWYYDHSVPGDPVVVTGSPLAGTMNDGYTMWFLSWTQWLHYSATHMAVNAGPTGSTLVDPGTLPATVSHSIIHNTRSGNFRPGNRPA